MKRTKTKSPDESVRLPTVRRRLIRTQAFDLYEHRFFKSSPQGGSLCIVFFELEHPDAESLNRAVRAAAEQFYAKRQCRASQSASSDFFSVTAALDETKTGALTVVCEHKRGNLSKTEAHRRLRLLLDTKNFRFCRRRDLTKKSKISIL